MVEALCIVLIRLFASEFKKLPEEEKRDVFKTLLKGLTYCVLFILCHTDFGYP